MLKKSNDKQSIISVNNLCKNFNELKVLKNISIEFFKGEVVSIIGPSGCGKSTFLRCINNLISPTSGNIFVNNEEIGINAKTTSKIRKSMQMVFQSFNLWDNMMIVENVMYGPIHLLKKSKQEAYESALKYLKMVGLFEKAKAMPSELSGGQKQRIAIARALAMEPQIILFDEPTSALDPTMVGEVLNVIKSLAENNDITMLIVTHEMAFAEEISDRILVMKDGVVLEEGSPEEIFKSPKKLETRNFIQNIKTFNYQIATHHYDIYGFNSELNLFLENNFINKQEFYRYELFFEELVYSLISPLFDNISINMDLFNRKNISIITIVYQGDKYNPFEDLEKELELKIIKKYIKVEVIFEYNEGLNKLIIKI